jgi:glycosyltransferase involved in cell wall biosynthesis
MNRICIHQVCSGFATGDAISIEATAISEICARMGMDCRTYSPAGRVSPDAVSKVSRLEDLKPGKADIIIYHHSIFSEATEAFLSASVKKILVYHNITPAEYFDPFDERVAAQLRLARRDLKQYAASADALWAVSAFDAKELRDLGFSDVKVFPLIFDSSQYEREPDPFILQRLSPKLTNILFVGRLAPNKMVEDLLLAFGWYNRTINPFSRLVVVGSKQTSPGYFAMLRMLAGELELANVCFEGFASPAGLTAYYRLADVFVTASRHEGYCLPILEAMYNGVPVIARAAGGIPEAMDGAGILFDDMTHCELAELINLVVSDQAIRIEVVASQKKRLEKLAARSVDEEFKSLIAQFLAR